MDYGLLIFLIFLSISLIVIARAAIKNKQKKDTPKRRYKPYQPNQALSTGSGPFPIDNHSDSSSSSYSTSPSSDSRAAYASADEYFRAGMFDRA